MKKTVLYFGLFSGAIAALMMFVTIPLIGRIPFEYLTVVGYATFVTCFVMVFFGIRSYRDRVAGGTITFGRAFKVGIFDHADFLCDLHRDLGICLPLVPAGLSRSIFKLHG
ncbi:MAG TPA: DUF4199 domain-containing protein [Pyrinomonadaceae bacterium]|nr:DUF4199 domain-containing protein [Pyrinomonadaceae bacterium]